MAAHTTAMGKELGKSRSSSPTRSQPDMEHFSSASSTTSGSGDRIEEVDVEPYDEFGEPVEVLAQRPSHVKGAELSRHVTGVSLRTTATSDPNFEVDFEDGDPGNPKNWNMFRLCWIILFISFSTLTVVLYSSSYTSGIPGMKKDFGITSQITPVLGLTTYLVGLAAGSVILAPLSEMYGRRPIYIVSMLVYCVWFIPSGVAHNLPTILVSRFLGAFAGSVMISNAPGSISDIVTEEYRALAFSCFSIGPMNGPVIGPLIGGFVYEYLGWRWTNWVVMICAGVSTVLVCVVPETYAPAILRSRAAKLRKETGDNRWWSRYDDKKSIWELLKTNLSRPFIMAVKEPICVFWNLYIMVVYAILYLCFIAYPIVFGQLRGWRSGSVGLAYVGIGVGALITIAIEPLFRRMINSHRLDPLTGRVPPEAMVSVVCVASILVPTGEIIFAWTCTPNVHWIVPILAGVPFGMGNTAVFIYTSNYLVHSYGVYAASALAGNSVLRSLAGGILPLAGPSLYRNLGPHLAGTLLACLEFALIPIPFAFWKYGSKIRQKSGLIRQMQEDQQKLEGKKRAAEERAARKRRQEEDAEAAAEADYEKEVVEKQVVVPKKSQPT